MTAMPQAIIKARSEIQEAQESIDGRLALKDALEALGKLDALRQAAADDIREFHHETLDAEYTDTDDAWFLLKNLYRTLTGSELVNATEPDWDDVRESREDAAHDD